MQTTKLRCEISKKDDYSSSVTIYGLLDHISCLVHNSIINENQKVITVEVVASDERRLCIRLAPEMVYHRLHGPDTLWVSRSLEV